MIIAYGLLRIAFAAVGTHLVVEFFDMVYQTRLVLRRYWFIVALTWIISVGMMNMFFRGCQVGSKSSYFSLLMQCRVPGRFPLSHLTLVFSVLVTFPFLL